MTTKGAEVEIVSQFSMSGPPIAAKRPVKGRRKGELVMSEVAALWGYSTTQTWAMITQEKVIPYRQDRNRIYVKRNDAEAFSASLPSSGRRRAVPKE